MTFDIQNGCILTTFSSQLYLILACECYIMSKYCFEEHNMFGASDWAIQAYKRWTKGDQSKCVDVERLIFKLVATSTTTGD